MKYFQIPKELRKILPSYLYHQINIPFWFVLAEYYRIKFLLRDKDVGLGNVARKSASFACTRPASDPSQTGWRAVPNEKSKF